VTLLSVSLIDCALAGSILLRVPPIVSAKQPHWFDELPFFVVHPENNAATFVDWVTA
jgi:hypothetical protein